MAYVTENMLRQCAAERWMLERAEANIKKYFSRSWKTIYLAHSPKDTELARGLVNYLAVLGSEIYVDWHESPKQRVAGRDSAEKVKKAISENEFFLLLASRNAMASSWVHWELGIAEQCKPAPRIAVVPVTEAAAEFKGEDYLALYRSVEIDQTNKIKMFEPGHSGPFDVRAWFLQ